MSSPQQPAQAPAPAYGGAPAGELVVDLRPFGSTGMITPIVTIDGHAARCPWGRSPLPAPVGVRKVELAPTLG